MLTQYSKYAQTIILDFLHFPIFFLLVWNITKYTKSRKFWKQKSDKSRKNVNTKISKSKKNEKNLKIQNSTFFYQEKYFWSIFWGQNILNILHVKIMFVILAPHIFTPYIFIIIFMISECGGNGRYSVNPRPKSWSGSRNLRFEVFCLHTNTTQTDKHHNNEVITYYRWRNFQYPPFMQCNECTLIIL